MKFFARLIDRLNALVLGIVFLIVIATVLIYTSIWNANQAESSADEAVHSISKFYLEELGERRAKSISRSLDQTTEHVISVFEIAKRDKIANQDELRNFLQMVKDLYGYDKLGVVDENELLYTAHSTISGVSRYNFLTEVISEPTFYTANLYGARKQLILAIPLDGVYMGDVKLKTSFIQIDLTEMLMEITQQTEENETFNNVYYFNGEDMIGSDFGGTPEDEKKDEQKTDAISSATIFDGEKNILSRLKKSEIQGGETLGGIEADFSFGRKGFVSFSDEGVVTYMYYTPVEHTRWMFTVMIRESAISNNISGIRESMFEKNIIQVAIIVIVMLVVFALFLMYSRSVTKKEKTHLIRVSQTDAMTGIYNRGGGEKAIRKAIESEAEGLFFLLDADKFKSINDNYGHDVGDQVIISIADALKHSFREEDILMRLGGDEFAVYAPGVCDLEAARRVIRRFFGFIDSIDIPSLGDRKICVSLGACFFKADDPVSFAELYKRADEKLYDSKEVEGNQVNFYD